jgi:hypothetical protein
LSQALLCVSHFGDFLQKGRLINTHQCTMKDE